MLAGCAPGANLRDLPDYTATEYRLDGGDQVRVITFGEDQLTGNFRVSDQGKIAVPLIGNVDAAGLTASQLADAIAHRLKDAHLITDPSIVVEVASYRPIFVLGEVNKPGQYPYQPGMTMLTAVAVAGGFTYRGVENYASDIRPLGGKAVVGKITPLSFVAPGDVINVFERRF